MWVGEGNRKRGGRMEKARKFVVSTYYNITHGHGRDTFLSCGRFFWQGKKAW